MNQKYTQEHIDYIAANIPGCPFKDLTDMFNRRFGMRLKVSTMISLSARHGLHNGRDTRLNEGWEPTQFKKGIVPWNKGVKGISYPGMVATQFKKGQFSANRLPIGSEQLREDGYIYVKIADGKLNYNWKQKHYVIWEAVHGPVPEGHCLIFGDGNPLHVELDNLILITRNQLVRLNKYGLIQNDIELTRSGIIIADVYNKIGERRRARKDATG